MGALWRDGLVGHLEGSTHGMGRAKAPRGVTEGEEGGGPSHVSTHVCGSVHGCRCHQPGIELVPFSAFQMIFHLCN